MVHLCSAFKVRMNCEDALLMSFFIDFLGVEKVSTVHCAINVSVILIIIVNG
jgi:hypothetical protein